MSENDDFSGRKRRLEAGDAAIAYLDEGDGAPVPLLHGCPFSTFVGRKVIPTLASDYRCLAPDLLGLGGTEAPADSDWSVLGQTEVVVGFLDALGVERVAFAGALRESLSR